MIIPRSPKSQHIVVSVKVKLSISIFKRIYIIEILYCIKPSFRFKVINNVFSRISPLRSHVERTIFTSLVKQMLIQIPMQISVTMFRHRCKGLSFFSSYKFGMRMMILCLLTGPWTNLIIS